MLAVVTKPSYQAMVNDGGKCLRKFTSIHLECENSYDGFSRRTSCHSRDDKTVFVAHLIRQTIKDLRVFRFGQYKGFA